MKPLDTPPARRPLRRLGAALAALAAASLLMPLSATAQTADFTAIATLNDVSNVLTINPQVIDVKTVQEFVAKVKAEPGKYTCASTGNGNGSHLAFAEFNARAGLDLVHVPYKGGPDAMAAVLSVEVCCIMNQVQTVLAQSKAGKVRLLGVTTPTRVAVVQDVPTIAESGLPGFTSYIWFGLLGPKGMDPKVVERINGAVKQVLELPEIASKRIGAGSTVRIETPQQFRETVRNDRAHRAKVVKQFGETIEGPDAQPTLPVQRRVGSSSCSSCASRRW
jgi:tripartite-type tricarboxylate transporter receptor subunit TctC